MRLLNRKLAFAIPIFLIVLFACSEEEPIRARIFVPIADFKSNETIIIPGETVEFIDLSQNEPTEWYWDFGDGNTSLEQNPKHQYNEFGIFSVSLKVSNVVAANTKIQTNYISIIVRDIDENIYNAATIGEQTWLAQNLSVTRYNDGSPIELVSDSIEWANLTSAAYCWYNNDKIAAMDSSCGALYNWYAVNTEKLCPEGWHVPSDSEQWALQKFIAGPKGDAWFIGNRLKAISGWGEGNGSDIYGFNALPAGYRFDDGFGGENSVAKFWLSNIDTSGVYEGAWNWLLLDITAFVTRMPEDINVGSSVRCIQD